MTTGIVYFEANNFSIPFSIAGAEIETAPGSLALSFKQSDVTNQSTVVGYTKADTEKCYSQEFSKDDKFDFMQANSILKSVFRSLLPIIPDWIQLHVFNKTLISLQDLRVDLVRGHDMNTIDSCKGAPVISGHSYAVFRFGSAFSISLLGDEVNIPEALDGKSFCLIIDVCNDLGGTFFLVVPEESTDVLLEFEAFQNLSSSSNLTIRPRGIGISLVKGINVEYSEKELEFWNGDRMFQYR